MSVKKCPTRQALFDYIVGKLTEEASETVADHVGTCTDCLASLEGLDERDDALVARLCRPVVLGELVAERECEEAVTRTEQLMAPLARGEDGSETQRPDLAGLPEELGEYRILEKIGHGGMGSVYKARHTKLDRLVALKVLLEGQLQSAHGIARFDREMKLVGALAHPNVVQAHDAREIDHLRFLVMEFVDGADLGKLVAQGGPLPIADACELVRQAAMGLQAVHEHGLVHRDIKPSNLMLTHAGQLKILDLGLARMDAEEARGTEVTGVGQAMGTADYMAPEQASDSHTVDIRADIYSLGCTLYKLLTGRAPFSGPKYTKNFEKLSAHVNQPVPPIQELRDDVPAELVSVLDRMLAKQPDGRFAQPAEVSEALAPFCADCELPGLFNRPRRDSQPDSKHRNSLVATDEFRSSALVGTESMREAAPQGAPGRSRPRWKILGVAAAVFAVLLGVVLTLTTANGTLIVESDDPNVRITVEQNGKLVRIVDADSRWQARLKLGEYQVVLSSGADQFQLDRDTIVVTRGGKETLRVTLRPRAASRTRPTAVPWDLPSGAPPPAVAPFDEVQAKHHQQAWADHLGVPVEFQNSIGMKMVLIPPGEFMMGCTEEEIAEFLKYEQDTAPSRIEKFSQSDPTQRDAAVIGARALIEAVKSSGPQRKVTIVSPYYIAATEVTFAQFEMFVDEIGYETEAETSDNGGEGLAIEGHNAIRYGSEFSWRNTGWVQTEAHPVVNVSWNDSVAFTKWLSEKSGRVYRLPNETEWEFACRAGSTGRWCWGSSEEEANNYAWCEFRGGVGTKPVAMKRSNSFGLFDMHGNVCEWCLNPSWKNQESLAIANKKLLASDHLVYAWRGGQYKQPPVCLSAGRPGHAIPTARRAYAGFRPIVTSHESADEP